MKPLLALVLVATPALADAPVVEQATAIQSGDTWNINVILSHPDTGWDHYADGWRVEAPDGTELGFRELLHPHVNEQPFTRSLSGVTMPEGLEAIHIRPRCIVDGWADAGFRLAITP